MSKNYGHFHYGTLIEVFKSNVRFFTKHLWKIKNFLGNIYNCKMKYSLKWRIIVVIYKHEDLFQ